jgi:hypothetical protein
MKKINPLLCVVILCGVSGAMSPPGSGNTFQNAANSNSQDEPGGKEATILIDHNRPPCVYNGRPQWCYLLARAEKPKEFPYFYGDVEGFKFQWGHEYRLLVAQEEAPESAASRYSYRLIKILSDKKVGPQRRFDIPLKPPFSLPFINVDESSNIYLLEEVKITTIDAKLKARLLRLLENATPLDSIRGEFKHDQKRDNVIILVRLSHQKVSVTHQKVNIIR